MRNQISTNESLSETEQHVRDIAERYVDKLNTQLSAHDLEAALLATATAWSAHR